MQRKRHITLPLLISAATVALAAWLFSLGRPSSRGVPWTLLAGLAVMMLGLALIMIPIARIARARDPASRTAAFFRSRRGRLVPGLALALVYLVVVPVLLRGPAASMLAGVAGNLPMSAMFLGFAFLGAAASREGKEPRCAACGYDLTGAPDPAQADSDKCPECGAFFRLSGRTVTGRRTINKPFIGLGVALVIASFSFAFFALRNPTIGSNWHVSLLPTGSLIKEVTAAPRGFTRDEWMELSKRPLTPRQEARLARGLIDLRARRGFVGMEAEPWLEKFAASGAMPAHLLERYYAEWLEIRLVVPGSVRVGEWVHAGIAAQHRGNIGNAPAGMRAWVLVGGFTFGDDPTLHERRHQALSGITLQPTSAMFRRGLPPPNEVTGHSPLARFVPDRAGDLRVRATIWIAISPLAPDPVLWSLKGEPLLSQEVAWLRRLDLDATVRVDPAP